MSFEQAESQRALANAIELGTITAVDGATGKVRAKIGELETPWIEVGKLAMGDKRLWFMPSVGEQVVIACPGGDVARAVTLGSVAQGNAPSADAGVPMLDLGGGEIAVRNGTVRATGCDVIVEGGDVIADSISLKTHTHGGVTPGGGSTGGPQ